MGKKKILVVDDSRGIRETVVEFLNSTSVDEFSLEAEAASNGKKALERIEMGRFDLVISDINMPGVNGIELARRIRCNFPSLPIILMSSDPFYQRETEDLKGLADQFLSKPFDPDNLLNALASVFEKPKR